MLTLYWAAVAVAGLLGWTLVAIVTSFILGRLIGKNKGR